MKGFFRFIYVSLFALAIVLSFSCIYQIINVTQERYLAQRYQKKVNTISRENYSLFYGLQNGISLKEVEEIVKEKEFTQAKDVTYLQVSSREVVSR